MSSSIIDRVAADLGRRLVEVPVGFKWFVDGLLDGSLGFGGEESAGASFLRRDGGPWSTDKDGLIPCLLAAEMKARDGRDPGEVYADLADRFGHAAYRRIDVAATPAQKDVLKRLSPEQVQSTELAGEPISRPPDERARQRRAARRAQGRRRARLVRGAPVGHRGRLQGLRREPGRRAAARAHPRGGAGDRRRGARRRMTVRVVTFNTGAGNPRVTTPQERFLELPFYREALTSAPGAPILALQEVGDAQARALRAAPGTATVLQRRRPGLGNALVIPARYEVLQRRARFYVRPQLRGAADGALLWGRKRVRTNWRQFGGAADLDRGAAARPRDGPPLHRPEHAPERRAEPEGAPGRVRGRAGRSRRRRTAR